MTSSSIEVEYGEINKKENGWSQAFQTIKDKCELEAKQKQFTLDESKSISNRKYNRYRDVNPYDHSRIVLHRGDTDYINANLVKMERANRKYILTQGPLQQTVSHFWLMVWEQDSKAILMLNKLVEKKQVKCHLYWPEKIGEEHRMNLTDVGLIVEYLKVEEFVNFSIRTLRLTDMESTKSREILQFHYTTWPDFGIPSSPVAFLLFLKKVRESGALDDNVGPPVVHCSAGIGRSGTFCLVDCCLVLIEREGENKVSVQDVLLELRRFRMGLIQTVDQLYFSYQAIIEGIKRLNNPNDDDYEEVAVIQQQEDEENGEQAPPPLPPPRVDSLHSGGTPAKPLPSVPADDNGEDALPVNGNNADGGVENGIGNVDRPLPPLPRDNSLEKVDESQSDHDSLEDEDEDELAEDEADEDEDAEMRDDDGTEKNGLDNSNDSFKSDENIDNSQEEALLRRRKRQERQDAMAEKVREIKRKQKMSEESSPKKRRTPSSSQSKSERGK
ncbi:tyrosine-protein phosphatase non-receptor type 61F isoform X2 [Lutzomyia longipalpis]|uniref:tyrosine-protein phosphatase non-receptor type 61F isoform X2 n=1 Tax=Lutzomyia longipalpis TaxID=7200 RepID=UPI002483AD7F|nr:tyrosine-protein phosphatase non-receptor type 61F isoform X2 [Lutzomyia longipalpis]